MASVTRTKANGTHQEQEVIPDQGKPAGASLAFRVMPLEQFVRTVQFTKPHDDCFTFSAAGNAIMRRSSSSLSHLMTLSPGLECRYFSFKLTYDNDVDGWFVGTSEALDEFQAFEDRAAENHKSLTQIQESAEAFIYGGADPYVIEE